MKAPAFYAVFAEVDTGGGPVMVWDNDAAFGTPAEAEEYASVRRAANGRRVQVYRCEPVEAENG